ncbi:polysaccharide pyruvyl transferase family protein [Virgibacillus halodenitrificans]|uniref:polysaccharide pyruvyl transferase family protein n=1 Tax=Virgibacillus halodenitrificans TaxID=1482 RepID=UPI002DB98955|nr:polysaccharide pyruvyl transferase family protein [Virgibacillus halodenitrificans]MEC2158539.1 polysaccharide pyruvyl transferase family protein [Virgibacillus halodenitrificans]
MKNVRLYAYAFSNFGDDLFIKIICERYPHVQFTLYAPRSYKKTFAQMTNLTVIANDSLFRRVSNLISRKWPLWRGMSGKRYDAVVYIGGSLFIQSANWKQELEKLKAMQLKDTPFYLLGANFGPYTDIEFYLQHRKLFESYTDICFRDTPSYQLFKELPNVRIAPDVVFTLQIPKSVQEAKRKSVAISVIKPSIRKHLISCDDTYYKKISEIAAYFIRQDYHVQLLAFCAYEEDHEATKKIHSYIPASMTNKVTAHLYEGDPEEMIQLLSQADMIIASRFHAMVLGWLLQKPVFPITYSQKMIHVMHDIGFKGSYSTVDKIERVTPESVFQTTEQAPLAISAQIKHAENQFKKLDMFLQD